MSVSNVRSFVGVVLRLALLGELVAELVEVTLTPDAGDTIMTLRHTGLPVAIADEHRSGWEHFLPQLAAAVDRREGGA